MKKILFVIILLFFLAGSFLFGSRYSQREDSKNNASGSRRILYYVDPMNPGHTSDKPGLAPCGMKMEPVYADNEPSGRVPYSMPPGTVRISSEKQQLIGVRVGQAEKTPLNHFIRTIGRVAVHETKIYRINASVDGWIKQASPNSVGTMVKKGEVLATFYSPQFLDAEQGYLYALGTVERLGPARRMELGRKEAPNPAALDPYVVQRQIDVLRSMGMGDTQIEEIGRTRQLTQDIRIASPVAGFITVQNVSPDQKFLKGTELYQIADLSVVWILADIYEHEVQYFKPGVKATVSLPFQKKSYQATVSKVFPVFDATTRTLKVRLETDNPGFHLRPDMFVDVEFPVTLPPTLFVPVDAVLDSGLRKTVFVDLGNGFFEPRQVETGWRMGDRVEIVKGLMAGERIVISGTFLLDSESRMKMAAARMTARAEARSAKDPVCGMDVDEKKANTDALKAEYRGRTYYFCADECKQQFQKNPGRYLRKDIVTRISANYPGTVQKHDSPHH